MAVESTEALPYGIKKRWLQHEQAVAFQFPDNASSVVLKACYKVVSDTLAAWPQASLFRAMVVWPRVDNMGFTPHFRRLAEYFVSQYADRSMQLACVLPPSSVLGHVLRLWVKDIDEHYPNIRMQVFGSKDEALLWLLR